MVGFFVVRLWTKWMPSKGKKENIFQKVRRYKKRFISVFGLSALIWKRSAIFSSRVFLFINKTWENQSETFLSPSLMRMGIVNDLINFDKLIHASQKAEHHKAAKFQEDWLGDFPLKSKTAWLIDPPSPWCWVWRGAQVCATRWKITFREWQSQSEGKARLNGKSHAKRGKVHTVHQSGNISFVPSSLALERKKNDYAIAIIYTLTVKSFLLRPEF